MCESGSVRALVAAPLPAAVIPRRAQGLAHPSATLSFSTPVGFSWGQGLLLLSP